MASIQLTRPGYSRSIDLAEGETADVGRYDCCIKRDIDGNEKKVSRVALRLSCAQGMVKLEPLKHDVTMLMPPDSREVKLKVGETLAAAKEMSIVLKHAAEPLVLTGTFDDVWSADTDASGDMTEEEESLPIHLAAQEQESQIPDWMGETQLSQ